MREEKCRREMSAAGGIGLWDTGDFSPATIHKIHNTQTKKRSLLSFKTHIYVVISFRF